MILLSGIILFLFVFAYLFLNSPAFGKAPEGSRLLRIKKSTHYKNGRFENLHYTPQLAEGYSMTSVIFKYLFKKTPGRKPKDPIPVVKTNLHELALYPNSLVWFGHSSYLIIMEGKRILVDPVFSGNASPIPGTNTSFKGTEIYSVDDLPHIDYLFITHDHYDHLDYRTILKLKRKTGKVICGLGVGAHFEAWGYDDKMIIEKDWNDSMILDKDFTAFVTPARHFSGRKFSKDNTLWCAYVLQTPSTTIYLGGDSGYDTHFAEAGEKFGPFELAILDNGQYNRAWEFIHALPQQVLTAAKDLKAKQMLPVHSSKFALANHPWHEPLDTITKLNEENIHCRVITPMIGEVVYLNNSEQVFSHWWKGVS